MLQWLRELGSNPWLSLTANLAQVVSVVVVVALWRWHLCRVVWCFRPGRIRVGKSSWHVCPKHHTPERHEQLVSLHASKHPDRIGE